MKNHEITAGKKSGTYFAVSVTEEDILTMTERESIQSPSGVYRYLQVPQSDCEDEAHMRVFKKGDDIMTLLLSSTGNPDHGQNPGEQLFGCEDDRLVIVRSFQEASVKCMDYIQRNSLGSGNWSGGQIYDGSGSCIAMVSYNGRVWDSSQREID